MKRRVDTGRKLNPPLGGTGLAAVDAGEQDRRGKPDFGLRNSPSMETTIWVPQH
jgi:hypothetical protein